MPSATDRLAGTIPDDAHLGRWGFAAAAFGVALWTRFALWSVLPAASFPFLTFFPAVLLTAYVAGMWPGLVVSVGSVVSAWYWFLGPPASFGLNRSDTIALLFFGSILLANCVVVDLLRRAMLRADAGQRRMAADAERLQRILDGLLTHAWLLDAQGRVVGVNRAPLEAAGLVREAVLGQVFVHLPCWDAQARGRLQVAVGDAARGAASRQDVPCRLGDAELVLDLQVVPLRDAHGAVEALLASAVDVSSRVQAARALERSRAEALAAAGQAQAQQRLLDATFNAVPAAIIVADAQGALVRMNRATQRIWGQAPASGSVLEYAQWRGWWADGSARQGQPVGAQEWGLARSLASGRECSDIVEIEPFGEPGQRRTTLLSSAPVLDGQGRAVGAVVAQIDITDRVRAEAALRESEERFRLLADNIPQLAWMAGPDGAIDWYNQRWFDYTGTTPEVMQGWGWKAVHHPDHLERATAKYLEHLASGQVWEDTFPLRSASGTWRWFLSRAVPLRDAQGRIQRWFGTNTDVTEQREIEQSLREADRQKDVFLATLAHELRNPLAPIRTAGQIVRLRAGQDKAMGQAGAIIERQSAHLARLVDDLLDLSRIRSGKLALRLVDGDLREAVDGAVETCQPMLEAAGQTLRLDLPAQPLPVRLDPVRAVQCIANVLHNASKFSPPGGVIGLSARADASLVRVSVRDHGRGIPAEMLPRVFDMFVQERSSGMGGQTGLGIGLALTRHLMELHGGQARAHSAGLDRGAEFELDWPLRSAENG